MARKTVTYEGPEAMASKANLIRRNGRWYYNRAYPKDLWSLPGKRSPFRLALKTESLAEAERARPEAERLYHKAVDEARLALARAADAPPLTHPDAVAVASEWFRTALIELEDWFLPTTPEKLERAVEDADEGVARLREALATGDLSGTIGKARDRAKGAGFRFDPDCPEVKALARLLLRGEVALAELYKARLLGNYGARPSDVQFAALLEPAALAAPALSSAAAPVPAPKAKSRTLEDLERAYRADRVANLSQSSQASYEAVFRFLRDMLGKGKALAEIDRDTGRSLFDAIQKLPAGLGRKPALRGLSAPEAIREAERLGLPRLSPKTINDVYMGFISAIFGWAVREGWMPGNPVEGLRVKEQVAAADKRDPFTVEQLNAIFAGPPWSPRDPDGAGKPVRFWGPLLALLLGMRRGEIAQLRPGDVLEEEGCWVLEVRGEQLKTAAARRTLPLHRELIRLGFPQYAAARRKAGAEMLFEGEKPNKNGQWGDGLSDWFNRELKRRGITAGRRLGMHSFRHNFQDRLREAGLHGTPIGQKLAGRASGRDVSDAYGRGFSVEALAEAMDKVRYPGLRL